MILFQFTLLKMESVLTEDQGILMGLWMKMELVWQWKKADKEYREIRQEEQQEQEGDNKE